MENNKKGGNMIDKTVRVCHYDGKNFTKYEAVIIDKIRIGHDDWYLGVANNQPISSVEKGIAMVQFKPSSITKIISNTPNFSII